MLHTGLSRTFRYPGAGTALSLTLRYSRTQEGPHYLASVAVIYTEAIKLALCLIAQMLLCR